ncbi:MAG: hypothetical protein GY913_27025 [Proteobacteria bacterium]|nr:hypothetical protein [Pseudomonadota bacterium]MCP4920568.1 hypothetical protein [Pseudomonadota bacterium]
MILLLACTGTDLPAADTGSTTDSTPVEDAWPSGLAEIGAPTGTCPDLAASGTSTMESSGEERTVSVVIPDEVTSDTGVVLFLHGLMDPGSTPNPTEYMIDGLGLDDLANDMDVIVLVPESGTRTEFNMSFFLWDVEGNTDADMVLMDDLRNCVYEAHQPDMTRMSLTGFSGGALFATMVASTYGDSYASLVEMSGGADIEVAILDGLVAEYSTPAYVMPALLWSGGSADVWPNESFPIVDFAAATDNLEANLAGDGHTTVRCGHDSGHTVTNPEWRSAVEFLGAHRFGEASPYAGGDVSSLDSSCSLSD